MFGFCRPPQQDLEYRSIYSRCCQYQRQYYGLLPLRFTSYESTLLLACVADANPTIKIKHTATMVLSISKRKAAGKCDVGTASWDVPFVS